MAIARRLCSGTPVLLADEHIRKSASTSPVRDFLSWSSETACSPLEWCGAPLCRITAGGGAQFRCDELEPEGAGDAFQLATEIVHNQTFLSALQMLKRLVEMVCTEKTKKAATTDNNTDKPRLKARRYPLSVGVFIHDFGLLGFRVLRQLQILRDPSGTIQGKIQQAICSSGTAGSRRCSGFLNGKRLIK